MNEVARRSGRTTVILTLVAALLWAIAVTLCVVAYAPVAKNGPDIACALQEPDDIWASSAHSPESVTAEGSWRLLPVGLECRYTATDSGQSVSVAPSWVPSAVLGIAFATSIAAACTAIYRRLHSPTETRTT